MSAPDLPEIGPGVSLSPFNRPGVTDGYLSAAGCHHVDEKECVGLYGFKAAGIAIPFRDLRG